MREVTSGKQEIGIISRKNMELQTWTLSQTSINFLSPFDRHGKRQWDSGYLCCVTQAENFDMADTKRELQHSLSGSESGRQ